jgi:hypothetical protein
LSRSRRQSAAGHNQLWQCAWGCGECQGFGGAGGVSG